MSMLEFNSTKQWTNEPIVDYINRWCSLSFYCIDWISEISAMAMYIQGMHWDFSSYFKG